MVSHITEKSVQIVKSIPGYEPVTRQLQLNGKSFTFEVDIGAKDNFCSTQVWNRLGKPTLQPVQVHYVSVTGEHLTVSGTFNVKISLDKPTRVGENKCPTAPTSQLVRLNCPISIGH